jgi:phytol kinase
LESFVTSLNYWQQFGIVAIWMVLVFSGAAIVRHFRGHSELVRKIVHIGTGNVILLAWGLKLSLWLCLAVSIAVILVTGLSYFVPVLPILESVGRKTHGVFYYAVSIGLLVAVFWSLGLPQFAVIGVLVMTWGDGLAALIGKRFGKRVYRFNGNKRTLEGSAAMLVVSYAIALLVLSLSTGGSSLSTWLIPLPIAIVATVLEAVSPGGTDNLTVPISSAFLCYGLSLI